MTEEPPIFMREAIAPRGFAGRKVTVMGLGLFGGGLGLTRALAAWGARVTVTDLAGEEKLARSLESLRGMPVELVLGRHREEDFLGADLVFVNPAVPHTSPFLRLCRERGVPLETEMNLFFKLCRGRVCAITGSNGKTTTTRLTHAMASRRLPRVWLGGNLGRSLLGEVESILPEEWCCLEVSSFQLEDLASIDRRPEVALVTNLSPNHLDRHGSYGSYLEAKRVILEGEGWAILCGDDARLRSWGEGLRRRVVYYGQAAAALPRAPGVWVTPQGVLARGVGPGGAAGGEAILFRQDELRLRGRFNLVNAAGAAAAALAMGAPPEAVREGAAGFLPVPYRLELVHVEDGVEYYNDSIATTPESAVCALEALGPRVVLIAGGHDKGSSFGELGRVAARRSLAAVLIGKTAPSIEEALGQARPRIPTYREPNLEAAVRRARSLARPGDRVVLSPACASFDMFVNFEHRGDEFNRLVRGSREGPLPPRAIGSA